jgi:hypothetical protein
MKYGQKLKLGDAHLTPRNIQEVKASNLGDAKNTLVFTLIVQRVFSFSSTAFSFHFSP